MANKVELYNNGVLVGTDNSPVVSGSNWTYSIAYTADAGNDVLTAKAFVDNVEVASSGVRNVVVNAESGGGGEEVNLYSAPIDGQYINASGSVITASGWAWTGYIPIDPTKDIHIEGVSEALSNKLLLNSSNAVVGTATITNGTIPASSIPANATKLAFNVYSLSTTGAKDSRLSTGVFQDTLTYNELTTNFLNTIAIPNNSTLINSGPGEVTGQKVWNGLNRFTRVFKRLGLDSKIKAVYPFIGGTASSHMYNLLNPQNTDAAFRLTFTGAWVHDGGGIKGDGSSTYARTYYNQSVQAVQGNESIGVHVRIIGTTGKTYIGAASTSPAIRGTHIFSTGIARNQENSASGQTFSLTTENVILSRVSVSGYSILSKDTFTNVTQAADTLLNLEYYIGARNTDGTPSLFTDGNISFAFMGAGLTQSETVALGTIIRNLQIELNRQT